MGEFSVVSVDLVAHSQSPDESKVRAAEIVGLASRIGRCPASGPDCCSNEITQDLIELIETFSAIFGSKTKNCSPRSTVLASRLSCSKAAVLYSALFVYKLCLLFALRCDFDLVRSLSLDSVRIRSRAPSPTSEQADLEQLEFELRQKARKVQWPSLDHELVVIVKSLELIVDWITGV